jgi:hypothetical protein
MKFKIGDKVHIAAGKGRFSHFGVSGFREDIREIVLRDLQTEEYMVARDDKRYQAHQLVLVEGKPMERLKVKTCLTLVRVDNIIKVGCQNISIEDGHKIAEFLQAQKIKIRLRRGDLVKFKFLGEEETLLVVLAGRNEFTLVDFAGNRFTDPKSLRELKEYLSGEDFSDFQNLGKINAFTPRN